MSDLVGYDLPTNWTWTTIGSVSHVEKSHIVPKDHPNTEFNYLSIENVESGTGNLVNFKPTKGKNIGSSKLKFTTNDILYSKLRPYLNKVHIPMFSGISATDLIPIRPENGVRREYLAYYLRTQKIVEYLNSIVHGIQLPRVSVDDLLITKIPFPPLNEQKRIVSKIEELVKENKSACEALDKIPQIMKKFRQSVLAAAFRGELVSQDPNDESAEKLLERIKQERRQKWEEELRVKGKDPKKFKYEESESVETNELPELPDNWLWSNIGMIEIFVGSGITPLGGKSVYVKKGIPFIRSQNVYADGLHLDDVAFVTPNLHKEMSRTHVRSGDVLLNITGASIGRCTFVPEDFGPANVNQHVCIIRTVPSILPKYLSYWLNSPLAQDRIFATEAGVTREGLNYTQIRSMPLPLTSITTQNRVIAKIEELFSFAGQIEKSVEEAKKRADRIDQAILAKAFRGELVPQDPRDEPASVLLERIMKEREELEIKSSRKKVVKKLAQ